MKTRAAGLCFLTCCVAAGCGGRDEGPPRPPVSIKATELDDEDVPTVSPSEAGSLGLTVPVLSPGGRVIVPPDRRDAAAGGEGSGGEKSGGEAAGSDGSNAGEDAAGDE